MTRLLPARHKGAILCHSEQQGWPGAAGQPRIICPGCTRGCLFLGLEGEASAQHPVSVLLPLPGKSRHTVAGTGHAGPGNPMPVGSAPGARVAAAISLSLSLSSWDSCLQRLQVFLVQSGSSTGR